GRGQAPWDASWLGEAAVVSVTVSRWNEDILEKIQARPAGRGRGKWHVRDTGRLMLSEGWAAPLWLKFSHRTLQVINEGQPAGYRFPRTFVSGPDNARHRG